MTLPLSEPNELPAAAEEEPEELERMTLLEHLEELRKRLLWSFVAMFGGFAVCLAFAKQIFAILQRPIGDYGPLNFLRVTDPFLIYMKVALLASVFVVSPFLLYQLWKFVSPGLYRREKRLAMPFIFFGTTFFLAGGLFGYFIAVPMAVRFLLNMGEELGAESVITISEYLNFLVAVLLGLGVMFELPILIFMLSMLGVVTPRFLMRHFRWAVIIIFLVAAIITPTPDVVNLCVVALPTILLYLLGVGAAALAQLRRKRESD